MKKQRQGTAKETAIRIQAPEAQEVFLAGSFNDWNPSAIRDGARFGWVLDRDGPADSRSTRVQVCCRRQMVLQPRWP